MLAEHTKINQNDAKWMKKIIRILVIVCVILSGLFFYATYVEPNIVTVNEVDIVSEFIPMAFHELTIVQFSDTHLGDQFTNEDLRRLVDRINGLNPDIVIFTGDLFDHYTKYGAQRDEAQLLLSQMEATFGKFAVYGNHDRGGGGSRRYEAYLEEAGFEVLVNETHSIELPNGQRIVLAGLDDAMLGNPKMASTLSLLQKEDFNVVVVHQPDLADQVSAYPVDLQLSGHSHGGQVQSLRSKPIYTPPLAQKYVEGLYRIEGTYKSLQLYVNRGIGTTRLPIRFMSTPELTEFRLMRSELLDD